MILRGLTVLAIAIMILIVQAMIIDNYDFDTGQVLALGIIDGIFYMLALSWAR